MLTKIPLLVPLDHSYSHFPLPVVVPIGPDRDDKGTTINEMDYRSRRSQDDQILSNVMLFMVLSASDVQCMEILALL